MDRDDREAMIMFEGGSRKREGDKPRQVSTSWGRFDGGIVGDIHPTGPKYPATVFANIKKPTKVDDQPRKDSDEFYTSGAAVRDGFVQATLGGKDLGDGLVATAVEVVVWIDPSGIVRALRIARTVYHVFFGSSKEDPHEPVAGGENSKHVEQDLATNHRNMVFLSENAIRSAREAAAEAWRQHVAYLEEKKKRRPTYGKDDLRD